MERFAFSFTEHDTPDVRARIGADLARIAQRVEEGDPWLVALVLTGGFSRGEGTFRDGAPVNDYDLVAVRSRPGGGDRARVLGERLTREIGLEVDLLPVWRARLPHVGRKLFWLDLKLGGRIIAGDAAVLDALPAFGPAALDPRESARLLGNRAAGLLLALPAPGEAPDPRQTALQSAKAVLAAMDASLLHAGLYAPTLRERLGMSKGHEHAATFARAVEWKLAGGDSAPVAWSEARDALLDAVARTRAEGHADGWTERAFHLLRARRLRASPSREIRRAAWDLLRATRYPEGPAPDAAEGILARIGPAPGRHLKEKFFAARARTLQ